MQGDMKLEIENYSDIDQINLEAGNYLKAGDFDRTIEYCSSMINSGKKSQSLYQYLAKACQEKKEIQASIDCCLEAVELYPGEAVFYGMTASLLMNGKKDFIKARYYIDKALWLDPQNTEYLKLDLCNLIYNGNIDTAQERIREHVSEHPNDQEYRKMAAGIYLSYSECFYEHTESGDVYLNSKAAFESVLYYCGCAMELYNSEDIRNRCQTVAAKGKTAFNTDNIGGILILFIAGLFLGPKIFPFVFLAVLLLSYFSYKPAWLIEKMHLTGKSDVAKMITHAISNFVVFIFKMILFVGCLFKYLFLAIIHLFKFKKKKK